MRLAQCELAVKRANPYPIKSCATLNGWSTTLRFGFWEVAGTKLRNVESWWHVDAGN
jgi:hypothetical protein